LPGDFSLLRIFIRRKSTFSATAGTGLVLIQLSTYRWLMSCLTMLDEGAVAQIDLPPLPVRHSTFFYRSRENAAGYLKYSRSLCRFPRRRHPIPRETSGPSKKTASSSCQWHAAALQVTVRRHVLSCSALPVEPASTSTRVWTLNPSCRTLPPKYRPQDGSPCK
jgi:hypothetical protein